MNKTDNIIAFMVGGICISIAIGFKTHSVPNGFIGFGATLIACAVLDYFLPVKS